MILQVSLISFTFYHYVFPKIINCTMFYRDTKGDVKTVHCVQMAGCLKFSRHQSIVTLTIVCNVCKPVWCNHLHKYEC
uniref:Uncharacterized protein n=1 Tax=Anguilla anguilla TaxID=7936 RepID=A0A0E9WH54_ANGAN